MRYAACLLIAALPFAIETPAFAVEPDANEELPLEVVRTFKPLKGLCLVAAFSPDEKILAAASRESDTLVLWDVETGKEVARCKLDHNFHTSAIGFSADGKTIALDDGDPGVVHVFDASTGKPVRHFMYLNASPQKKAVHQATASTFSPSSKLFAVTSSPVFNNCVELWDVEKGKLIGQLSHAIPNSVAFSADEKMIATQDAMGEVRVWDLKGKLLHTFKRPGQSVKAMAAYTQVVFSPDGKHLATSGHLDQSVRVWNLESKKIVQEISLTGTNGIASTVVITPDSKWVGVGYTIRRTNQLQFYDIASGKTIGFLNSEGQFDGKTVQFGEKGNYLTVGGVDGVRLYGAKKGREKDLLFFSPVPSMEPKPNK